MTDAARHRRSLRRARPRAVSILAASVGMLFVGVRFQPAAEAPGNAAPSRVAVPQAPVTGPIEPARGRATGSRTPALARVQEASGLGREPLSPRNANYSIDVRLDPRARTLDGRAVLTWRNISNASAADLRFHLYYNAWKNTRSTWMRERLLAGPTQLADRPEADWGWSHVTAVRLLAAGDSPPLDLTRHARFIAPDDGNPDDQTVLAVPLPDPVDPGETVNVEIEWTAKIPRTFSRTGAIGDYFFLAQWFPKVGVLEDAGWNCRQFHSATEFYADYGVYDVRMTVPTGWIVGATGVETERRDNPGGTTTHRYYQEDVHDFAWTTSPHYLERRARFEHPNLPPVEMRLLLQPEHAGQEARHFEATRAALRYYGEWYGPYPYGHITIVDPAWQSGAGGMEYPTLFTAGTRWLAPEGVAQPESVTVHEAGHQFWYGIVGNNEFEHAWLDEGLNTFSTARVLDQAYRPHHPALRFFGGFVPYVLRDIVLSRETDGNRWATYRTAAKMDVQSTPTYRYWPGTASRITYDKTALWLHTLERYVGWPTLQRILSTYFQRWQFRHPKPEDFFAVAQEVAGRDLDWFFDQVHRSSNVFDYGIQDLTSRPATARGFFDTDGARRFVADQADRGRYRTDVVVRRYGEAIFPVDVLVVFENGEQARERWDGRDRWRLFTYERPSRAVRAVVDPDRVLLLDVNLTNNGRTLQPKGGEAATKWTLKWLVWLQDLLLTYGMLI